MQEAWQAGLRPGANAEHRQVPEHSAHKSDRTRFASLDYRTLQFIRLRAIDLLQRTLVYTTELLRQFSEAADLLRKLVCLGDQRVMAARRPHARQSRIQLLASVFIVACVGADAQTLLARARPSLGTDFIPVSNVHAALMTPGRPGARMARP